MKVFNIIACILILLLAIASAVFSYFLYEKRVQFVDGWTQMSTAIGTSAKTIDEQSDKKFAPELTIEKLSHKTYTEEGLRKQLKNLTDQSQEFIKKYNNAMVGWDIMANAIFASANTLDNHSETKFADHLTQDELKFDNPSFNADEFKTKIDNLINQSNLINQHYANARTSWDMMSKLIYDTAVAIDEQTNTKQADALRDLIKYNSSAFRKNALENQLRNLTNQLNLLIKHYNNAQASWDMMSKLIYDTAVTIDQHTGKKQAGELKNLPKYNAANFNENNFQNQIGKLTAQLNVFVKYYTNAQKSWDIMSKAIYAASALIDDQTGKRQAAALEPTRFSMYNTDKFNQNEFAKQISQLVTQVTEFTNLYANTLKGWKHMHSAILKASANMDRISARKYATTFRNANFDNTRYNDQEFQKMIALLVTQSDDAAKRYEATVGELNATRAKLQATEAELARRMTQLNAIAQRMASIGTKVSANGVSKNGFVDLRSYAAQMDTVNGRIVQIVDNRARLVAQLAKLVSDHKGSLDQPKLLAAANESAVRTALTPVTNLVYTQKNARISYAKSISEIAGQLGIPFKDDIYGAHTATAGIVEANRKKLKVDIPSLQTQLANAHLEIVDLKNTISNRDKTIADQKVVITDFQKTFDLVQGGGDTLAKPWERGSVEARSALVGTVTKVSPEYGYIVIDFGSDTVVIQKIGSKVLPVNPELESGLEFNVVRDGQFVAAITLNTVDNTESTADLPISKADMVKVGDKVVFKK